MVPNIKHLQKYGVYMHNNDLINHTIASPRIIKYSTEALYDYRFTAEKYCNLYLVFHIPALNLCNATLTINNVVIGLIACSTGSGSTEDYFIPYSVTLNKGDIFIFANRTESQYTGKVNLYLISLQE